MFQAASALLSTARLCKSEPIREYRANYVLLGDIMAVKPRKKSLTSTDDQVGMNRDLIDEEGIEPELGSMDAKRESDFAASEAASKKKKQGKKKK